MSEIELSVLLPAYNEADNLTEVIPAIAAALDRAVRTSAGRVLDAHVGALDQGTPTRGGPGRSWWSTTGRPTGRAR